MGKKYECSFCKKAGVKLWHPMEGNAPLICAKCAEIRQSKILYNEYIWSRDKRSAHLTGRKKVLPIWKVRKEGDVPSYAGPNADGLPLSYTTTLIVDLEDKQKVPFIPANDSVNWAELPTT